MREEEESTREAASEPPRRWTRDEIVGRAAVDPAFRKRVLGILERILSQALPGIDWTWVGR
jgi:hypothetical protein